MNDTRNLFLKQVFLSCLAGLITILLISCGFGPTVEICASIDATPVKELTASDHGANGSLFDDGTIFVYHGFGCAESKKSGTQGFLKVEQSLDIPQYATNATVFLNGWHLQYLNSEHNVALIATLIRKIGLEGKTLKWEAGGVLSDANFDDPYNWCYYYTVVAWNSSNVNLTVDQNDGACASDPSMTRDANYFEADNKGTITALSSFPSFLQNPDFASIKTVAILPRGFGFGWGGGDDHQLIQIGYNLDHSETFMEKGKKYYKGLGDTTRDLPSEVDSVPPDPGFVSWETYAIFKDDDMRRDYSFGEIVTGLGGNDIGVIQPPFSILPEEGIGLFPGTNCMSSPAGIQTQEFVIENVPYEYAIPMLTGWQLSYGCQGDQPVKEIGVWIADIHYEKNQDTSLATLRYNLSSIISDGGHSAGHSISKVTILGLKPVAPGGKPVPDLVPFSPSGTGPTAFCRLEQNNNSLRVSIKNQGNADAGTSKTTVTFGNNPPQTVDTPAIPAGGSADLLFRVLAPSNCLIHNCPFKITVDSTNQVDELNEGNNTVNGGC